jgi:hypothetical protein
MGSVGPPVTSSAGRESGTGGGGGVDGRRRLRVVSEGGARALGVELVGFQSRAADSCWSGRRTEPVLKGVAARRVRKGDCRNESGAAPRPLRRRLFLRDGRPGATGKGGSAVGARG